MKQPTFRGRELLPLSVIEAARAGDPLAVERVLRYYEGYMDKLCTRTLYDLDGTPHVQVDEYMKRRVQNRLIRAILTSPYESAGRGGLLALRPAFSCGVFYAFQSLFQRGLEQSYCRPVKRVPEASYGGLFSGLTA